ncbi:putative DNA binding domain-containing protein [Geomonas sp. Red32]|uniref:ATP-binding protein n=1 Tax=Geomonas sp. Red32 TaxID=2912856 RepID=UPI00202CD64B|nr:ATP-binding protein [Geomonas sp. Red32]MCM0080831.1 putative DNA binding domain-containing protein [Geomonas sp. Red32]
MDPLLLSERIKRTIELSESQFREFKSAWEGHPDNKKPRDSKSVAKDISETLVSFANAEGGELLIGVEDDGTVTGIGYRDEIIGNLLAIPKTGVHKDTPLVGAIARTIAIEDKTILYFSIDKSTVTVHQTSDGKCMQRRDRENCPVSAMHLQFERQEQLSREYDRSFVDRAEVLDLNLDSVRNLSEYIIKMSPEKCLQYLGLAEYGMGLLKLRRAALLLFAKDVSLWHPRCQVRVVRVRGIEMKTGREYNVTYDEVARGNILELINSAWEKLRPHLVETKLTPDTLFKEQVMYPEDACKEALINAVVHRDYSIEGQGIEIFIYDDRMEIKSPGSLLSTIKVDELRKLSGRHESRNALIARTLKEIGYVREMGEGMRRIFQLMMQSDLVQPELKSVPGTFSITLRHRSVFSEADQVWLNGFKPIKLSREEMLIALLGKAGKKISPQQIYDTLNLVDWDVYRSIFEQAHWKGLIYNAMAKSEKNRLAANKKMSKRELPRIAVHDPEVIEKSLLDIFSAIRSIGPIRMFDTKFIENITSRLPEGNIYKSELSITHFTKLLVFIQVIDENKLPTKLTERMWDDSTVSGNEIKTKGLKQLSPQPASGRRLYVANLPSKCNKKEINEFFSNYGTVTDIDKRPYFAFVEMSTCAEAETILRERSLELLGSILKVSPATPKDKK